MTRLVKPLFLGGALLWMRLVGELVVPPVAIAEGPSDWLVWNGHAKYQLTHGENRSDSVTDFLGSDTTTDQNVDLRHNAEIRRGQFAFDSAAEFLGVAGDTVPVYRELPRLTRLSPVAALPNDDRRLFDLSAENDSNDRASFVTRLDRLAVGLTSDTVSGKFGRQVVSWGNGLLFQVLDPFNPFAPTAIDKDYKTGDDSVYLQWLRSSGDDLQLFVVPRRNPDGREIAADQSSFALKWRGAAAYDFQYDLVGAAHYGEQLWGVGISRSVHEAVVRADFTFYERESGGTESSFLVNLDRSWELWGRNWYALLEYFHSGVGADQGSYTTPSVDLSDRLQRGELFTLGRDYIGTGARLEATPLFNLFTNFIFNLHDASEILQFRMEYDLLQDLRLFVGANLPVGGKGSEFGGIALPPAEELVASPATQGYVRIAWYFGK